MMNKKKWQKLLLKEYERGRVLQVDKDIDNKEHLKSLRQEVQEEEIIIKPKLTKEQKREAKLKRKLEKRERKLEKERKKLEKKKGKAEEIIKLIGQQYEPAKKPEQHTENINSD